MMTVTSVERSRPPGTARRFYIYVPVIIIITIWKFVVRIYAIFTVRMMVFGVKFQ